MLIGTCFVRKPSQLSRHSTCAVPLAQPSTTSSCIRSKVGQVWIYTDKKRNFHRKNKYIPPIYSNMPEVIVRKRDLVCYFQGRKGFSPGLFRRKSCWPACVALRWYWNSGASSKASVATASCRWRRRNNQGVAIPSSKIQRAWHRIGNRKRKAIQPAPNAYEDAAQTIGGRIPTAKSPTGFTRKARPPATHTHPLPSRSVCIP